MQNKIIMPKATALWLKLNTKLTMEQIADFCDIDLLTLDSLIYGSMKSHNPLISGQLTEEEIQKGEENPHYKLKTSLDLSIFETKRSRKHIPMAHRKYKKEMIVWFLKKIPESLHYEETVIKKIAKVLSSNYNFVKKIIDLVKNNPEEAKEAMDPFAISVCSMEEIKFVLDPDSNKKKY